MTTRPRAPKAAGQSRKRACEIRATNLEEILATCERHIANIGRTQLDLLEEGDGTPTDDFYINMFRGVWQDLRDDVQAMLEAQKSPGEAKTIIRFGYPLPTAHVVACTEHEFGQRDCGHTAFLTEKAARDYMRESTANDAKTQVPGQYFSYSYLGIKDCSAPFYERLLNSGPEDKACIHFDRLAELKGP